MSPKTQTKTKWVLASAGLRDAATDFFLSRRAAGCSRATMQFYEYMLGPFLSWLEARGVADPQDVTARLCREFVAEVAASGKSEGTVWNFARSVRTLCAFWLSEKYVSAPVTFQLPKVTQKRLPCPTPDELRKVLDACNLRDRALVLLMADSGLRRAEVVALDWRDVNLESGLVLVRRGKGGKPRSAAVGPVTLRALRKYRREAHITEDASPVFLSRGGRFTGPGILRVFQRLSRQTSTKITPHSLRRYFATESLRAGMGALHLAGLLGHASLEMTRRYTALVADDLVAAHEEHDPLERLLR